MLYKTKGPCSTAINFEVDGDTLKEVAFTGGCNGNLQGISRLVKGKKIDDIIATLEGISCGGRPTSCPDQLARALKQYKEKQA